MFFDFSVHSDALDSNWRQLQSSSQQRAQNFTEPPSKPTGAEFQWSIPLLVIKDVVKSRFCILIAVPFVCCLHIRSCIQSSIERGQKQLDAGTQTHTDAVNTTSICLVQMCNPHTHWVRRWICSPQQPCVTLMWMEIVYLQTKGVNLHRYREISSPQPYSQPPAAAGLCAISTTDN